MSDTTDSPDPIVVPNTEDPRSERLAKDGVDIDSPHFDAEADAAEHADEEPADAADEPTTAPAEETPADTGKAPKTGSIPKQSAPSSDSSDSSTK